MPSAANTDARIPWLIVISGCLIALMTFGPRSAMGFFQLPMLQERGWDRSTFGLAMAIQNLFWGLGQPFFGAIADKYGTWRVLACRATMFPRSASSPWAKAGTITTMPFPAQRDWASSPVNPTSWRSSDCA